MCSSEFQSLGSQEEKPGFVAWPKAEVVETPVFVKTFKGPEGGTPLRQDARKRAEQILEEAKARAAHIEREAFEVGFAQGERAGRQLAEQAIEDTLRALGAAHHQFEEEAKRRSHEVVQEVVRLALAVARKVLQREVRQDSRLIVDVVRSALGRAGVREEVTVRVHPLDCDTLVEARGELLQELEEVRSLRIEADESVERGGALVQCSMGELDLRLERQFREIELAFERLLEEDCAWDRSPADP